MDRPIRIIAEVGTNWGGDQELLGAAIAQAHSAGATAIKYQIGLDELYDKQRMPSTWQKLQRYKFPVNELPMIKSLTNGCGMELWASVFTLELLDQCAPYLDGIKIASGDIVYRPMLARAAYWSKQYNIPLAISTGAASAREIWNAILAVKDASRVILMKCTSQYPADSYDANLAWMTMFETDVDELGFSDHTCGFIAAQLAVALRYTTFETHFTPKPDSSNPDNIVSFDMEDLYEYVSCIHAAARIVGNGTWKITEAEEQERLWARRAPSGKRPAQGLSTDGTTIRNEQ